MTFEISPFLIGFQHVFGFPLPQGGFQFGVSLLFGLDQLDIFSIKVTVDLILHLIMIQ